jgi:HPt (histidine-containing phosphotransfer) domain-containing protein
VKSSSLYIGAEALSQKAKQLEFAARDKEIAVLRENHEELLREYKELLEKLRKVRYSS